MQVEPARPPTPAHDPQGSRERARHFARRIDCADSASAPRSSPPPRDRGYGTRDPDRRELDDHPGGR